MKKKKNYNWTTSHKIYFLFKLVLIFNIDGQKNKQNNDNQIYFKDLVEIIGNDKGAISHQLNEFKKRDLLSVNKGTGLISINLNAFDNKLKKEFPNISKLSISEREKLLVSVECIQQAEDIARVLGSKVLGSKAVSLKERAIFLEVFEKVSLYSTAISTIRDFL